MVRSGQLAHETRAESRADLGRVHEHEHTHACRAVKTMWYEVVKDG